MAVLNTIGTVLFLIVATGLIVAVIMQSGKSAGLGSIAGGAQAIFGKKKGMDDLFAKLTTIFAIAFLAVALVLSILQG
ncbi:MAG: preprotein translocase subunit SecG [Bacillota bacterium]